MNRHGCTLRCSYSKQCSTSLAQMLINTAAQQCPPVSVTQMLIAQPRNACPFPLHTAAQHLPISVTHSCTTPAHFCYIQLHNACPFLLHTAAQCLPISVTYSCTMPAHFCYTPPHNACPFLLHTAAHRLPISVTHCRTMPAHLCYTNAHSTAAQQCLAVKVVAHFPANWYLCPEAPLTGATILARKCGAMCVHAEGGTGIWESAQVLTRRN